MSTFCRSRGLSGKKSATVMQDHMWQAAETNDMQWIILQSNSKQTRFAKIKRLSLLRRLTVLGTLTARWCMQSVPLKLSAAIVLWVIDLFSRSEMRTCWKCHRSRQNISQSLGRGHKSFVAEWSAELYVFVSFKTISLCLRTRHGGWKMCCGFSLT